MHAYAPAPTRRSGRTGGSHSPKSRSPAAGCGSARVLSWKRALGQEFCCSRHAICARSGCSNTKSAQPTRLEPVFDKLVSSFKYTLAELAGPGCQWANPPVRPGVCAAVPGQIAWGRRACEPLRGVCGQHGAAVALQGRGPHRHQRVGTHGQARQAAAQRGPVNTVPAPANELGTALHNMNPRQRSTAACGMPAPASWIKHRLVNAGPAGPPARCTTRSARAA